MKSHIANLNIYSEKLNHLTNALLEMQDKYEVTTDLASAERLSGILEELKSVIDNLPLA